nr:uncharacterized protein I203_02687 [Kwoniella mangroviensis CBS 8507]OCF68028.1 hypothetical protein I203_02687 [Kwoniella mangroviensis CBS 8507]
MSQADTNVKDADTKATIQDWRENITGPSKGTDTVQSDHSEPSNISQPEASHQRLIAEDDWDARSLNESTFSWGGTTQRPPTEAAAPSVYQTQYNSHSGPEYRTASSSAPRQAQSRSYSGTTIMGVPGWLFCGALVCGSCASAIKKAGTVAYTASSSQNLNTQQKQMAYPVKPVMTSKQDNTLRAAAEDTISPGSAASHVQSTEATRKDTGTLDDYLKIQQRDITAPNRERSTLNQMTYSALGLGTGTDTGEANRSTLNQCAGCPGSTACGG